MAVKLKIGLVLDDGLDRPDGAQQYVLTLGRWLSSRGHEVHYLVGETRRGDLPNLHSLARNFNVRFNGNRLSIPLRAPRRQINERLKQLNLDVLHVQLPYHPLMSGRVIKSASGVSLVGTFHILPSHWLSSAGTRVLGWLQRRTLCRFDRILTPSSAAQHFARHTYGVISEICPNPVELKRVAADKPPPRPLDQKIHIVYLGRLVARKGCQQLLEALTILNQRRLLNNVRVSIGGSGPLAGRLKAYSARHGLDSVVSFDGFIDERAKPAYLAAADLAVFPSVGGESFGIVLIEAMAAGAGVVAAADNPGYHSVLGVWPSVLARPGDADSLADCLNHLINNPAKRQRLHAEQQAAVKNYDIEVIGPRVLETYRCAIAKRRQDVDNKA